MDGDRTEVSEGTRWEQIVGYSRLVRTGPLIFVSGTLGVDPEGRVVAPGDAYLQARRALERIAGELERVGAGLDHVVRTRIFVTAIEQWEQVARAHREAFPRHRPTSTLVEVSRFVDDDAVVEIEADAYVP